MRHFITDGRIDSLRQAGLAALSCRSTDAARRNIGGVTTSHRVILIEPLAPTKPALGAPCNGCGICCLAEPCPVGMLVSRKLAGRCDAVLWDAKAGRYRCGLVGDGNGLHARVARRWIAAGSGCDSHVVPVHSDSRSID